MRFEDLKFKEHQYPGGIQAKAQFGKYLLSVVSLQNNDVYEVGIFDGDDRGSLIKLPGIHPSLEKNADDVIHRLSPDEVSGIMLKLQLIGGPKNE